MALLKAKEELRKELDMVRSMESDANRMSPTSFREEEIAIAECRNLLNCIEERLPHVRP